MTYFLQIFAFTIFNLYGFCKVSTAKTSVHITQHDITFWWVGFAKFEI